MQFPRVWGSASGAGAGKRASASTSTTREAMEEEQEEVDLGDAGVQVTREDVDALVADPITVLRRARAQGYASSYDSNPPLDLPALSLPCLSNPLNCRVKIGRFRYL